MRLHRKRKKVDGVVAGAQPFRLPTLKCRRCGHEWHPKTNRRPVRCAKCKSPYWDREREKVVETERQQVEAAENEGLAVETVEPIKEGV
jgi:hypothetical protein